ncbi:hypothetical protein KC19_6G012200 [Ceratodon purpureus]|uniref:Uncharacterized protein n=1 Tax=Ceratodon purpureus TaxID=3225 RepID=A0A8T0H8U1_CERPU|nr:hypothetical protein KC19_6G012200 [Ceratodon purpureus]
MFRCVVLLTFDISVSLHDVNGNIIVIFHDVNFPRGVRGRMPDSVLRVFARSVSTELLSTWCEITSFLLLLNYKALVDLRERWFVHDRVQELARLAVCLLDKSHQLASSDVCGLS